MLWLKHLTEKNNPLPKSKGPIIQLGKFTHRLGTNDTETFTGLVRDTCEKQQDVQVCPKV